MGTTLRWDPIPNWAKDPKIAYKTISARAETLDTAPSYRQAFKKRRCLIPMDGFYERKVPGDKIPYSISMKDDSPFVFGGLWEGWKDPANGEWLHTCTIITGEPKEFVRENPFKPNVDLIDRPSARAVSAAMHQPQRGVDMARVGTVRLQIACGVRRGRLIQFFPKGRFVWAMTIFWRKRSLISLWMAKPTKLKPRQCSSCMTLHRKKGESIS
jgi:hypothetical protein